jgi:hypothetical protein
MHVAGMTGLSRITSTTRRRAVWDHVLLGGIERLTERLMSGVEFSGEDLSDMRDLRQRLRAFDRALEAREKADGIFEPEPEIN